LYAIDLQVRAQSKNGGLENCSCCTATQQEIQEFFHVNNNFINCEEKRNLKPMEKK
jgi:hypothetical protein